MTEFEGVIVTFLDLVHSLTVSACQRRPLLCKRRCIFGALVTSCQTDIADEAAVCNAGEEFVLFCSSIFSSRKRSFMKAAAIENKKANTDLTG